MKAFKTVISIVCIISIVFSIGCNNKNDRSAEDILDEILGGLSVPSGSIYIYGAPFDSDSALSVITRNALYTKERAEHAFSLLDDYAIYLSSVCAPYEAAVFRCRAVSDADTLTSLCLYRADVLNVLLRETSHSSFSGKVKIRQSGRYVAMVLCDSPEEAERVLRHALP